MYYTLYPVIRNLMSSKSFHALLNSFICGCWTCIEPFKSSPNFSSMQNPLSLTQPVNFPLFLINILSVVIDVGVTRGVINWRSWTRAPWYNYENDQQVSLCRLIYYSKSALHVAGDVFAHHQEHLTAFTVSDSIHPSRCRLVSRDTSR